MKVNRSTAPSPLSVASVQQIKGSTGFIHVNVACVVCWVFGQITLYCWAEVGKEKTKHTEKCFDHFKGDQTILENTGFVEKAVVSQITVT